LIPENFWWLFFYFFLVTFHGDFASQVTAQDVSTMLRCGQRTIIFLINNGGYTIEVEIHDGPYNVIKNWNYTGLVDAIHNGEGKCWTAKVSFLTWRIYFNQ
jgi:pyruvate decarboxylase